MLYSIFLILGVICGVLNIYEGFMLHNRLHETNEPTEDEIKQMRNYILIKILSSLLLNHTK